MRIVKKIWRIRAWIHPKEGGDDYEIEFKVKSPNEAFARRVAEHHLAKHSAITTDYQIKQVKK